MPSKPSLLSVCEPVELNARDRAIVTSQIGRELLGACAVVVRDGTGRPVVIRNEPFLYDGTPMPTRYWLVGEDKRAPALLCWNPVGGVRVAAETVDTLALDAAHLAYATERDAAIDPEHVGPRPPWRRRWHTNRRQMPACALRILPRRRRRSRWEMGASATEQCGRECIVSSQTRRLAAVDIGTNSVRLLVADVVGTGADARMTTVERLMRMTQLGQGVECLPTTPS